MNKNLKWYMLIAISVILLIIYGVYNLTDLGMGRNRMGPNTEAPTREEAIKEEPIGEESIDDDQKQAINKLPIPPLLKDKNPEEGKAEFDLKVQCRNTLRLI